MRSWMSFACRYACSCVLLLLACVSMAQTNIAPSGTGYTWHTIATATATSNQTASTGVNDGNLTTGINVDVAGEPSNNQYEAAGVIFSSAQNGITKVDFINGAIDTNGNGFFEANLTLQTYNGSAWSNVSGWTVSPAYPYTTGAGGVTYSFTGAALNNVSGVRVVGEVRVTGNDNSWSWIVNEVRVYASGTASPDFTFSASPSSQTVTVGSNASYTVSVAPLNGFTGAVVPSVSGVPSGASASFNPTSIAGGSGSSTLTVNSGTAAAGTYTLTVTGTSASLSHTASVTLVVTAAPNFSLSATPASQTVTAGSNASYTASVSPLNGFTGAVALSVSGVPSGATASFKPASISGGSGSSTLTVNTGTAAAGTYTLTVTGTSGSLSHTASVTLVINASGSLTNIASSGTGYTWHTMATATATSNQTAATGVNDSNLTVGVDADAAGETTTNQYEGGGVIFASTQNSITKVDFINGTISSGGDGFFEANLTLQTYNGSTWSNVSGWTVSPAYPYTTAAGGVTYTFTGAALNSVLGVRVVGQVRTTAGGNSWHWIVNEVRVYASSGTASPDFSFSASPSSQTVTVGGSTSYTASVSPLNAFTGTVALSVSGVPSGATASFNPTSITGGSGSSTLTVNTGTAAAGTYTLTVTGMSGSLSHSASVTLVVTAAPDFSLSTTPASQAVAPGSSTSYSAGVAALNGFNSAVTFSVSGLPTGVTGSFSPTSVTGAGSSTLTMTTSTSTAVGTYNVTVTGTSGSLSHSVTVNLVISTSGSGNFTISISPATQTVNAGNAASYTATIAPTGGFTGTVTLSVTGLPTAGTGTLTPATLTGGSGSSTLNVATASSLAAGNYNFTVTGVSGSLTHSVSATLTVNANAANTISWMNHLWDITPLGQQMGSGCTSDPSLVSVDANGYMHLTLTTGGSGVELFTHDLLGFGTVQWQFQGNNIYNMDPSVVFGPMIYGPGHHPAIGVDGENEMDMEFSKWGTTDNSVNADFTYYYSTGNRHGSAGSPTPSHENNFFVPTPPASGFTTARTVWGSSQIIATLMDGLQPIGTSANVLTINNSAYSNPDVFNGDTITIPQVALPAGVNIWCVGGAKPAHNWEVIIRSFQYVPGP